LGEKQELNTGDYFSFQQDKNAISSSKCSKIGLNPLVLPRNDRFCIEGI